MGLRIRTNIQSLTAQRNLLESTNKVSTHMQRLSSGYRINKAADDAAGLAISESLKSDIRSMAQARRNANDGVSLLQVAEGGLDEINNIMTRLRELSVQAASDTIGMRERQYLNLEFMQLKDEVDRIAVSTQFNGTHLLVGNAPLDPSIMKDHNYSPLEIQVGKDYLTPPDSLDSPNPINIIRFDFRNVIAMTGGEGGLGIGTSLDENGTRVDSKQSAQHSMAILDEAITKVSSYRAFFGSMQSRLVSTDRNLAIGMENLSAAKSRIQDADFAQETAEYTQANILQQAGVSVLAQANQMPQVVLKLLQ